LSANAGNSNQTTTPLAKPTSGSGSDVPHKGLVKMSCFVLNAGLSVMVAATGALAVGGAGSDAGLGFIGVYLVLFAAILFTFEVLQLYPMEKLDDLYKRNFGFLYGYLGKSFYLLL
jgi:hypothetical protein